MQRKVVCSLMAVVLAILATATVALAQGKLICISQKGYKGEQTVNQCLAKGEEFAIVDQYGVVRILSKREIELTKAFNPKFFEQRAYSMPYQELAPELKLFGYTVRPAQPKQ